MFDLRRTFLSVVSCIMICLVTAAIPTSAIAGPPYMTDDPEPPEPGHLEVYGPVFEIEGHGSQYGGGIGAELNYGAAKDLQLTVEVPFEFDHDESVTRWEQGDIALAAKYRFYNSEETGLSFAVYPEITLPVADHEAGNNKVAAFLPIWFQKDTGPWSIFGGGGYTINPGPGNRDYWTGGLAVTRAVSEGLTIGAEVNRQGPDENDARGSTSLGVGAVQEIGGPFMIVASVGPTFSDGGAPISYHAFFALGAEF